MRIDITIEGTTPLMLSRFTEEAAAASTSGTRGASAARDKGTPLEQADKQLYRGLSGNLIIPQPNLLRCIIDGGQFHKVGKKQLTTKKESMLYGALDIEGTEIPLVHKQPWKVDTRAVRIPATGGRILAHRPMFDDWQLVFSAILDTDILNVKLLRQIIDDAGTRVGLGVFRPQTKGPYGRFKVIHWTEDSSDSVLIAAE